MARWLWRLAAVLLVLASRGPADLGAQPPPPPTIEVLDPLRFTLRRSGALPDTLAFLVFAKGGAVSDLSVRVLEVKDPAGGARASAAVAALAPSGPIPTTGATVQLLVRGSDFDRPGDYQVTLQVGAAGGVAPVTKSAVLRRGAVALDLTGLRDRTIRMVRMLPALDAPNAQIPPLYIDNVGSTDVCGFSVRPGLLLLKDSKRAAAGVLTVTSTPVSGKGVETCAPRPGAVSGGGDVGDGRVDLPAGGRLKVQLSVRNLSTAGEFTTHLLVDSPSLDSAQHVPLALEVADGPALPFLTIALGVLLAASVTTLAGRIRPLQELRYRVLELRAAAAPWSAVIVEPTKVGMLEEVLSALRVAERRNAMGVVDGEATRLTTIETQLAALEKADATDRATARAELALAQSQLAGLEDVRASLLDDERARLAAASDAAYRVGALLAERRTDEAQAGLRLLAPRVQTLAKDVADRLQRLGGARAMRAARANYAVPLDDPQAPPADVGLLVTTALDARQTDQPIAFEVFGPAGRLDAVASFDWDFGDGSAHRDTPGPTAEHRFAAAGRYTVTVAGHVEGAAAGAAPDFRATRVVTVVASPTQRNADAVRAYLVRIDWTLTSVSLLVATVTGFWVLYGDKVFGSTPQYIGAFLWGFGIDSSVRGIGDVLTRLGKKS